jgi:hypothetical protein
MLKFTPGPWRTYFPDHNKTVAAIHWGPEFDSEVVADCSTRYFDRATNRANATLISKAPEMYAILEAIAQGDYVSRESVQEFLGSFNA